MVVFVSNFFNSVVRMYNMRKTKVCREHVRIESTCTCLLLDSYGVRLCVITDNIYSAEYILSMVL